MPADLRNERHDLDPDRLRTMAEAAELLGISSRHLQSLVSAGRIATVRIGRRVLFRRETLLRFAEATERTEGGAQ
jgi:excisionase family DNA binding protein